MYEAKRSGKGRVSTWSATVASEETALEPAANT
jgi:hypothetical protein